MVSQTGFSHFFQSRFQPRRQWPYHGLSDQGFFFDILDLNLNDHTIVSQTGSVVRSLTSYVDKVTEKKTVCETVVQPLTLKKPGL